VVLDEDNVSEAGVDEAFEMAFSHACVCVVLVPTFLALSGGVGGRVPPTPTAGRTLTSIAASSGSSSRRWTSTGPLTAPMMV
jgi:hypothetical protein